MAHISILFFIPAFSLGGIPPLSGFWAKFTVIRAGLETHHYILVTVALLVGVLTLFSMTKIWAEAFWKNPENHTPKENPFSSIKLPLSMTAPCIALAVLTIAIGLFSNPLFHLAKTAGDQLLNPAAYIETVLQPQP